MANPEKRTHPSNQEAFPAPRTRDELWASAALQGELDKLANLSSDENVNKADSSFFASLVKIAAVIKGSGRAYVSPQDALGAIKDVVSQYPFLQEREIERQWRNAYNYADPRYRRD